MSDALGGIPLILDGAESYPNDRQLDNDRHHRQAFLTWCFTLGLVGRRMGAIATKSGSPDFRRDTDDGPIEASIAIVPSSGSM
jgi:hypothetical protein